MLVAAFLVLSQVRLAISIPMIEITIRNFDNQMEPATRPTTHICEATKTITGILPEDWRVNVTTTNDEEYDNPDFFSIGDLLQKNRDQRTEIERILQLFREFTAESKCSNIALTLVDNMLRTRYENLEKEGKELNAREVSTLKKRRREDGAEAK